jgi:hypothetical protein
MTTNLILLVILILALFCFYILYRNNETYYFSVSLNNFLLDELNRILDTYKDNNEFHEDENNYYKIKEKALFLLDKYSYNRYLFSFKPLKLEKWFTEEELEFMKYLKQYRK